MTDEAVTYPIPGPHDNRCELWVNWLQTQAKTCRCERRAAVRALVVQVDNQHFVSTEALDMAQPLSAVDIMAAAIERLMRALRVALDENDRELVPSSLMVTTSHDAQVEAAAIRLEALTLPVGSLHDKAVLEVADDWRIRRLRS